MKLLFDQNLSSDLVQALASLFPESSHLKTLGMMRAGDDLVWYHAKEHRFTIISKDSDFHQRSLVFGAPPKVVWLRVGNCPTSRIEKLLRDRSLELHAFGMDPQQSLLILS